MMIYLPCQRADGNRYWVLDDHATPFMRYLRQDVLSMAETIKQFQENIERGQPGADEAYEDFKRLTKESITRRKSVCSYFHSSEWHLITRDSTTTYVHPGLLVYLIKWKLNGMTGLQML
jgi:hypothetical protein